MLTISTYDAETDERLIDLLRGYIVGVRPLDESESRDDAAFCVVGFAWHDERPCLEVECLTDTGHNYRKTGERRFYTIDDHIITVY